MPEGKSGAVALALQNLTGFGAAFYARSAMDCAMQFRFGSETNVELIEKFRLTLAFFCAGLKTSMPHGICVSPAGLHRSIPQLLRWTASTYPALGRVESIPSRSRHQ